MGLLHRVQARTLDLLHAWRLKQFLYTRGVLEEAARKTRVGAEFGGVMFSTVVEEVGLIA